MDLPDFINPTVMEELRGYLKDAVKIVNKYKPQGSKTPEPWLGETATGYHGGSKDLSDAFVAGFMWMDKLGMCAETGVKAVFRQTFYLGNYSLLDFASRPNPDFWLSLLYKRLVPNNVHQVTVKKIGVASRGNSSVSAYRFYAHSADDKSMVIYGMNLSYDPVNVTFGAYKGKPEQYLLTPGANPKPCKV